MLTIYQGRIARLSNFPRDPAAANRVVRVLAVGPTCVLGRDDIGIEVLEVDRQWRTVVKATDLAPLTDRQQSMQEAHGLPHEFAEACWRASDNLEITPSEARAAIHKYTLEFYNA